MSQPPNFENLPFRKAKTPVQYIVTGRLTRARTVYQILLHKKETSQTMFAGQTSNLLKKHFEVTALSMASVNNILCIVEIYDMHWHMTIKSIA